MSALKAATLLLAVYGIVQCAQPYPLPAPKGYKIPQEIREIIVGLMKSSPSISEFKEHYKLRYQDKDDLKSWLLRQIEADADRYARASSERRPPRHRPPG